VHGRAWTKIAKTTPCKVEIDPSQAAPYNDLELF
jgi:hypothetical protein